MEPVLAADNEQEVSSRLVRFLTGEAAGDDWERRRLRLLILQEEQRPGVMVHAMRVAERATALAGELGMSPSEIEEVRDACLLHDIGKIAVREEVLYKAGALNEPERREMRLHAAFGFGLLDVPGAPQATLDITKYHHERYSDGMGYFGLSGAQIPLTARIAAIADVHEALTAEREYKASIPEGQALVMMISEGDAPAIGRKAFDPTLLKLFVEMRLCDRSLDASPEDRERLSSFTGVWPTPPEIVAALGV
ncbi:putative nucleotidyltransferase with HDIG domain [Bradyrhizobium sp. USDA 4341]